jgi:hypothetical protein
MKTFLTVVLAVAVATLSTPAPAGTAIFTGDREYGGNYVLCWYRYNGELIAMTFKASKECPMTIEIDD